MFVLFYGGSLVANNELSGGDLMSYLLSIQNTQKSLGMSTFESGNHVMLLNSSNWCFDCSGV